MLAFLLSLVAAVAQPADTSQCAKVAPVSTSIDVVALQIDADCFGAAAASDRAARDALSKAATSAASSQKVRLDRIAYVKAHPPVPPPPPPPPPPTHTCPDGTVILATVVCPPPPPPPPATQQCPDGTTILATAICPPPKPQPTQVCPDGTVIDAALTCPVITPSPLGGWVLASSVTPIADNFAPSLAKLGSAKQWFNTNAPDSVGGFRFICGPGQILPDDPIVFPGQPGRSHLHQFYGNTAANAYSDYQSLRTTGDSTCNLTGAGVALNRSAYWLPAMVDRHGHVYRPTYVTVYYKRFPPQHISCTDARLSSGCVEIPTGLAMITGRDMTHLIPGQKSGGEWECTSANGNGQTQRDATGNGSFDTMDKALALCPVDGKWALTMGLSFPVCWDTVYIDSPDHRSHVAAGIPSSIAGAGGFGCPISPKTGKRMAIMPVFRIFVSYNLMPGDPVNELHLSSDDAAPNEPRGSTIHGDYKEAWSPPTKTEWTGNCFSLVPDGGKYLNVKTGVTTVIPGFPVGMGPASGSGGQLCDGFYLKGAGQPAWGFNPPPNRVMDIANLALTPGTPPSAMAGMIGMSH